MANPSIPVIDGENVTQLERLNVRDKLYVEGKRVVASSAQGFLAYSMDTFTITDDSTDPDYLTGFTFVSDDGFELFDAATGAVQNNTGRTISKMTGSISYHPVVTGTTVVYVFSEKSTDGGQNFTVNEGSLRPVELTVLSEIFQTKVSFIEDWADGEIIRFRIFADTLLTDVAPSSVSALGETVTGYSIIWDLAEI